AVRLPLRVLLVLADRALDGLVISQGPTEPAAGGVRHVAGDGGLTDDLLGLLLGPDKEQILARGDEFFHVIARGLKPGVGLFEVDNADPMTVVIDELLRLRIVTARLV